MSTDESKMTNTIKHTVHILKCDAKAFDKILAELKPWEFRKNDRDFKVNDFIVLQKLPPPPNPNHNVVIGVQSGTGRKIYPNYIIGQIKYLLDGEYGIPEGYCIMTMEYLNL